MKHTFLGRTGLKVSRLCLGTMNFGDRQPMLDMAHAREKEVKQVHPKANLANSHFVRVIFLLKDEPKKYHQFAATDRFTPKRRKP